MKSLIYILAFLLPLTIWSQIDIKDTRKQAVYVNGEFVSNHNNDANSLEKLLNTLRLNSTDVVEILPQGKITATLSNNFFESQGVKLEKFSKDTLIKYLVFDLQKCNDTVRFGFDENNEILNLSRVDSFPKSRTPYYINVRNHYDKYGDSTYPTKKEAYGYQPTRYVADTILKQDSTSVTRQYFFTKVWSSYKREHDNIDSLKLMPFSFFSNSPGESEIKNKAVRRHTVRFTHRKFQVMAYDTISKTRDTLNIQETPIFRK